MGRYPSQVGRPHSSHICPLKFLPPKLVGHILYSCVPISDTIDPSHVTTSVYFTAADYTFTRRFYQVVCVHIILSDSQTRLMDLA